MSVGLAGTGDESGTSRSFFRCLATSLLLPPLSESTQAAMNAWELLPVLLCWEETWKQPRKEVVPRPGVAAGPQLSIQRAGEGFARVSPVRPASLLFPGAPSAVGCQRACQKEKILQ